MFLATFLQNIRPVVHCISADAAMKAVLAAAIANCYPLLRKVVQNRSKIRTGSVIVYIDPNENRIIFNLVTHDNIANLNTMKSPLITRYQRHFME